MISRTATICNRRGLHARAAARFVKTAEKFDADIQVMLSARAQEQVSQPCMKDASVSGRSIMGLMMLAAGPGVEIELHASGDEADAALEALTALIAAKFDED